MSSPIPSMPDGYCNAIHVVQILLKTNFDVSTTVREDDILCLLESEREARRLR